MPTGAGNRGYRDLATLQRYTVDRPTINQIDYAPRWGKAIR